MWAADNNLAMPIERIGKLYAVEKEARFLSPPERVSLRREHAKPVFDDLEIWLKECLGKISGKTPLAKAIRYVPWRACQRHAPISIIASWRRIIIQPSAQSVR